MKQNIRAGIINIGDEILIGQIVNTNSAYIAKQLDSINIPTEKIIVVGDERNHILNAFDEMLSYHDIVLVTGGLGTTKDDITKNCICEYFDKKLIEHEEIVLSLTQRMKNRNLKINPSIRTQAMLPEDCLVIENNYGLAPGMWMEKDGKVLISTPGVPKELESMMPEILDKLQTRYQKEQYIIHKHIQTAGIGESFLSDMLSEFEEQLPQHIKLAYLPKIGYTSLRLTGNGSSFDELEKEMVHHLNLLSIIAKDYIFSYEDKTLTELVANKLKEENKTLSLAESCTGGYLAHLITSLPGSSSYFKGGIIAYSNEIKTEILQVTQSTLDLQGAVSEATVKEMAENSLNIFQTDYSIAISGIAGPDGGSEEKPIGTVWIAVANKHKTITQLFSFGRGRDRVIRQAANRALFMLHMLIEN
ncbi:competence/damage-inducible protein A [Bacteroidales bacterium OttesenSCG-928-K22]|nr:competence/damage-inducible protein A [Bacteroidales bacterium OttesenSCG-928-K22]